jgi:hypothetical protein
MIFRSPERGRNGTVTARRDPGVMDEMSNWPGVDDRYDPYDPSNPMWADPFWGEYCARPGALPSPTSSGTPSAQG